MVNVSRLDPVTNPDVSGCRWIAARVGTPSSSSGLDTLSDAPPDAMHGRVCLTGDNTVASRVRISESLGTRRERRARTAAETRCRKTDAVYRMSVSVSGSRRVALCDGVHARLFMLGSENVPYGFVCAETALGKRSVTRTARGFVRRAWPEQTQPYRRVVALAETSE